MQDNWLNRWAKLWSDAGRPTPHDLGGALVVAWSESHRHYHTLEHLGECLALLDLHNEKAWRPFEVALALWFHDAIYDTRAKDNERRSAQWMRQSLHDEGIPECAIARIESMILATAHHGDPKTPDERLMLDLDLAILGAAPARFALYEKQIRQEYAWVDDLTYHTKRREVLFAFANRHPLYFTASFVQTREARAHRNLDLALDQDNSHAPIPD